MRRATSARSGKPLRPWAARAMVRDAQKGKRSGIVTAPACLSPSPCVYHAWNVTMPRSGAPSRVKREARHSELLLVSQDFVYVLGRYYLRMLLHDW